MWTDLREKFGGSFFNSTGLGAMELREGLGSAPFATPLLLQDHSISKKKIFVKAYLMYGHS